MLFIFKIKKNNQQNKGFTIVELLVVFALMIIMSSIVVFKYRDFSDSMELHNIAYDVALAIREAQVFGISSRGTTTQESFLYGYGVNFSTTLATDKYGSYISFIDSIGNNLWFDTGTVETLKKTDFPNGYKIYELCSTPLSGVENCAPTILNILFQRPNVDAIIKSPTTTNDISAKIKLNAPSGRTAEVHIYKSGQVSVQ